MELKEYTVTLSKEALQIMCEHTKNGAYRQVADILNNLAVQVAKQEHAAEQEQLQKEVVEASNSFPDHPLQVGDSIGDAKIVGITDAAA